MKKVCIIFLSLLCLILNVDKSFAGVWINDLRTLFSQNRAVIMAVNVRTMGAYDKNGNDIIEIEKGEVPGNFVNAIPRLKEIKGYGFNTIHLLPITPVGQRKALGTAGSLYALNDFETINPQLDDKTNKLSVYEEARNFIREAHKLGIRVIVDLPSCGSYDLYMKNPQLFLTDDNNNPVIPSDWNDVRVFKTKNKDGSLNQELLTLHKKFVDLMLSLDADGIRADVATLKPYEFWENLIAYTRTKSPEFLFLAEAAPSWNEKVCKQCEFTDYSRLLQAGFDGYYGNFVNYTNFKSIFDIKNEIDTVNSLSKKCKEKKSVIGSFATHDILSPALTGGKDYATQLAWLSVTLPINPYFVDGFQTLDSYIYKYANQKASKTYTDDDYYYVHKGKIDIFNYSRKPQGEETDFKYELATALKFKIFMKELLSNGDFKILMTNNPQVFAFSRSYSELELIVILNKNANPKKNVVTNLKKINNNANIIPMRLSNVPTVEKSKIKSDLEPYEIQIILWNKAKKED